MKSPVLFLLFSFISLSLARADPRDALKAELMRADTEFCAQAGREGAEKAFLAYIANDGLILAFGGTTRGAEAVHQLYGDFPADAKLTWAPSFAEVAASGDLGYTTGTYEMRLPGKDGAAPRVSTGNYITIWKKQVDGFWKFVFDGGNAHPPKKS